MLIALSLLACTKDEPHEWPALTAGSPVVGAADGVLDLPVGTPMGGFSARAHYLGAQGRPDNRASAYTVGFVESGGIHTRPGMKVVWLTNGDQDLVLTQTDTIYSFDGIVTELTAELEARTGRDLKGKVVHTANHSHHSYGPFSQQVHFFLGGDKFNREILSRFIEQLADTAMRAYDDREPAAIGSGWAKDWDPDNRVYSDRRGDNNELVMFHDLPPGGEGKDPYLNVLRVDREDGSPKALVYTFPIHGIVLGEDNSMISSDASGGITHMLEEEFDEPVVVMHMQSSGGDASPRGSDRDFARIESLGEYSRDAIMGLWEDTPTGTDPISLETASRHIWQHRDQIRVTRDGTVDWYYRPFEEGYAPDDDIYDDNGDIISPIDEYNAEFGAAFCGDDTPLIPAGFIGSNAFPYNSCTDAGLISRVVLAIFELSEDQIPLPFPELMKAGTLATRFGPVKTLMPDGSTVDEDVFAGFFPAEPTYMFGEQWRRRARAELGYPMPMIVGYSQDHEGYFLPPEDWLMGGYEPNIALWGPLQAEHVMEGVLTYSEEVLATQEVREDPDPHGYWAPTEYESVAMPTEFQPDLTPDAGTRITEAPEYLFLPPELVVDLQAPAEIERVSGIIQLAWKGGDPMVDSPRVVLERDDGGSWVEVTTRSGRPVTEAYTDILLTNTPDPLYPITADQQHYWWAAWQAVPHVHDRAGLPAGTYRLKVTGAKYAGGSQQWPWASEPYELASEPFAVVPAEIVLEAVTDGLFASIHSPSEAWRLIDLEGDSKGTNPVRGELTVQIARSTGEETVAVEAFEIVDGRSHVAVDLTDALSVTVTDGYGNTGTLTF